MTFENAADATPVVEPGVYIAKCISIEDGDQEQFGPTVRWTFQLVDYRTGEKVVWEDGENAGEPIPLTQLSSPKMTPRSKARQWAEALLQRPIQSGESGAAIAKECIGKLATATIIATEDGYSRIEAGGLSPYRPKGGKKQQPDPEPEPEPQPVAAGAPDDDFDPFAD